MPSTMETDTARSGASGHQSPRESSGRWRPNTLNAAAAQALAVFVKSTYFQTKHFNSMCGTGGLGVRAMLEEDRESRR